MNRKFIIAAAALGILMVISSVECFGTVTNYGAADINTKANELKEFLFGPPIKIACIFGGAYGLMQSVLTSTLRPLLLYGGIALGANIIPNFIDKIFVTGALLP